MATAISSATSSAFSTVTIDGSVRQDESLHSSISQDLAILQDFATYLELRLKCVNISMLRRIFTDFLNDQEITLVHMMQLGCTIITMYPVLRTSAQRCHEAKALLSKPKHHSDKRGCVFLYLQHRTATRNIALLKQIFLDFVNHREKKLLEFVENGSQVMSVIPYELPQRTSLRHSFSTGNKNDTWTLGHPIEQQKITQKAKTKCMKKRNCDIARSKSSGSLALSDADIALPLINQKKSRNRRLSLEDREISRAQDEPIVATNSKRKSDSLINLEKSTVTKGTKSCLASIPATEMSLESAKIATPKSALLQNGAADVNTVAVPNVPPSVVKSRSKCGKDLKTRRISLHDESAVAATEQVVSKTAGRAEKSPLRCGRKIKASSILQDAASVAAMDLFEIDETSSVVESPSIRRLKASKVSLQDAASKTARGPIETDFTTSVAKLSSKRGKNISSSQESLHRASPLASIEVVESDEVKLATKKRFKRRKLSNASNVRLQDPVIKKFTEVAKSDVVASSSSSKHGQEPRLGRMVLQKAASSVDSAVVETDLTESAVTKLSEIGSNIESCRALPDVMTVDATKLVDLDVVKSTSDLPFKCDRSRKSSKVQLQESGKTNAKSAACTKSIRGRQTEESSEPLQCKSPIAATESDKSHTFMSLPTAAHAMTSKEVKSNVVKSAASLSEGPMNDVEFVSTNEVEKIDVAKSAARLPEKCDQNFMTSDEGLQNLTPALADVLTESDDSCCVPGSTVRRGSLAKTISKDTATKAATDLVELDVVEPITKSTIQRVKQLKVSSIPLENASAVAAIGIDEAFITELSHSECGKILSTSKRLVPIADTMVPDNTSVAAMSSVKYGAMGTASTKKIISIVTSHNTSLASTREEVTDTCPPGATTLIMNTTTVQRTNVTMDVVKPSVMESILPATESTQRDVVVPKTIALPGHYKDFEAETKLYDSSVYDLSSPDAYSSVNLVDKSKEVVHVTASKVVTSILTQVVSRISGQSKRGQKRKSETLDLKSKAKIKNQTRLHSKLIDDDKSHKLDIDRKSNKRGKPAMSEELCRSQLELAHRMKVFAAQAPWEIVFQNVSAPFDDKKHPALARKFYKFWKNHARAVWERNFWAPVSRRLNLVDFNKRNNRQLAAKNAFEPLIISAFKELGAAFFVMLDTQEPRHPGWWYRGPVVALFAFQLNLGEDAMWDYVKSEAFKRFPDCKQPVPLSASNSGAMRIRHERESASMWVTNHQETTKFLHAIATLKASKTSLNVEDHE
ncbi:uncharacterized protein PHALS_01704 [Plasmopara halstedii]|uniref:Uncharacterized protein n=1 Tax=Plasmopara halstedii TaxID=4781 RepID=A0A0P1AXD3_PLAHL|nr:uncharacterized protein PHALS_01704 [Plasmopara halstedii]CEG45405.1 hypothetical protein PHALS_01704 [Plasmopara halstedii]|eukprot:XP_024581774.1 hypothetical protein PHALS_01704 [Plasmopara halstedii]